MHKTKSQLEIEQIEDEYYGHLKSEQAQYEILSDFELFLQKKLVYKDEGERLNTNGSKITKEQEKALKQNYRAYEQKQNNKEKRKSEKTKQTNTQTSSQQQEQQKLIQDNNNNNELIYYDGQSSNQDQYYFNYEGESPYPTQQFQQQQQTEYQTYQDNFTEQENEPQQSNFMDAQFCEKEEKQLNKYRKKYNTFKWVKEWKKEKNNRVKEMLEGQQILQNNFYQAKRRHAQQQQMEFSKVYKGNQTLEDQQQQDKNSKTQENKKLNHYKSEDFNKEFVPCEAEQKYPLNHFQKQHVQRIKSANLNKVKPTFILKSTDTYVQDQKEKREQELKNFDKNKLKIVEDQYSSQFGRMKSAIQQHVDRIQTAKFQQNGQFFRPDNYESEFMSSNDPQLHYSDKEDSMLDEPIHRKNSEFHPHHHKNSRKQSQQAPKMYQSHQIQGPFRTLQNSKDFSQKNLSTGKQTQSQSIKGKLRYDQFQSQQQNTSISIKHQSESRLKYLREISKQNSNNEVKFKEFTIQKPEGTLEFPKWIQQHKQFQRLSNTKQFNMDKKILAVCETEAFRRGANEKQVICLFLQQLSLFKIMPESLLMEISGNLLTKSYEDSETICKKGDIADNMYIIYNGAIQMIEDSDTNEVNKVYKSGELVGKEAIEYAENRRYNLKAQGQTNLLLLSRINYQQSLSVCVEKMKPKIEEFLNKIPFLYQHFKQETINKIFELVKGRFYAPKEYVYLSGKKTDNFYIVMEGKLMQKIIVPVQAENRWPVNVNGQSKWEKRICSKQVEYTTYYESQDILGYYDLIHTNEDFVRTETVEAATDSLVLYINKIDFLTVFTREDYDIFDEYHKRRYTVTLDQRENKIRQQELQNKISIQTYESAIRSNLKSYNYDELGKKASKLLPLMQRGKSRKKQEFKQKMPYNLSKAEYNVVNTMYD